MNQFIFSGDAQIISFKIKWRNKKELLKIIKFLKFIKIEQGINFPDLKWEYKPDLGPVVITYTKYNRVWTYDFVSINKRNGITLEEFKEKLNINFI